MQAVILSLWSRRRLKKKKERKKKAVLQKETEESLRTELRAMEPDTVTLHPGETGRYDHGDDGMCVRMCVCVCK